MFETIAWISIIIGFVAVISISLAAMLIVRRREQYAPQAVDYDEAVRRVDAAADAALNELNKTAELILKDVDEKYQTLLFLYDLLEDKQKSAPFFSAGKPAEALPETAVETPAEKPRGSRSAASVSKLYAQQVKKPAKVQPTAAKRPSPIGERHEKIIALFNEGMSPPDIAKELDIGQGEVKLIIDLAERGRM